jgi:cytochrome b pre-mRNA-processing protein 6
MRRRVERLTNPVLATEAGKTTSSDAPVETRTPPALNEQKEMSQVNALYSLLENRYATAYPTPEKMRYPESRKTHYDDLLQELEAAPTRGRWESFVQRLKGRFRLT